VSAILRPEQSVQQQVGELAQIGPDVALANKKGLFPQQVDRIIPNPTNVLPSDKEEALIKLVQDTYGLPVTAELNGMRMNANYGLVGGEQHLPVSRNDKVSNHTTDTTWNLTGMTGKPGAWGFVADDPDHPTAKDRLREQWYGNFQTFLMPGWHEHVHEWYPKLRHQKMAMVNPDNGSLVVLSLEDSGPSPFIDRKFGASNEAMDKLGYGLSRKGPVYLLFIDDPNDTVPLGPVGGAQ
jgi:hypothetical protein